MDEGERVNLAAAYHRHMSVRLPNPQIHATFHAVIENQLAMQLTDVNEALKRLLADGLSRHEAIHAVGAALAGHLWRVQHHPEQATEEAYLREVKALTASKWLKGDE